MSNLKPRFRLPRPSRADGTLLPAACAGALVAMAGLQLALTGEVDLPDAGWSGGGARAVLPAIPAPPVPSGLQRDTIFDPARTGDAPDATANERPGGGLVVAGTITRRGRTLAIMQAPGGGITYLAPGGRIAGMRLLALPAQGALFETKGQRGLVPYGSAPPLSADAAEPTEDDNQ